MKKEVSSKKKKSRTSPGHNSQQNKNKIHFASQLNAIIKKMI